MKNVAALLGPIIVACWVNSASAQDQSCNAGGKLYESGKIVCMGGFEQECVNGSWLSKQRFCSEDSQFDVIREPNVVVPPVGGAGQTGVPPADMPADVVVPQP